MTQAQTTQVTVVSSNEAFLVENKGNLKARLTTIQVVDKASCETAIILTKELAALKKDVEADRDLLYKPAKKLADDISARYKPILEDIEAVGKAAKTKILEWQQAERDRQLAAEREAQRLRDEEALKKAAELQAQADEEKRKTQAAAQAEADRLRAEGNLAAADAALAAGADEAKVIDQGLEQSITREINDNTKVINVDAAVRTEAATSSVVKRWTYKVVDIKALPADMLEVNKGAIQAAIRAGERNIPGLEIYQEESLSIR